MRKTKLFHFKLKKKLVWPLLHGNYILYYRFVALKPGLFFICHDKRLKVVFLFSFSWSFPFYAVNQTFDWNWHYLQAFRQIFRYIKSSIWHSRSVNICAFYEYFVRLSNRRKNHKWPILKKSYFRKWCTKNVCILHNFWSNFYYWCSWSGNAWQHKTWCNIICRTYIIKHNFGYCLQSFFTKKRT